MSHARNSTDHFRFVQLAICCSRLPLRVCSRSMPKRKRIAPAAAAAVSNTVDEKTPSSSDSKKKPKPPAAASAAANPYGIPSASQTAATTTQALTKLTPLDSYFKRLMKNVVRAIEAASAAGRHQVELTTFEANKKENVPGDTRVWGSATASGASWWVYVAIGQDTQVVCNRIRDELLKHNTDTHQYRVESANGDATVRWGTPDELKSGNDDA